MNEFATELELAGETRQARVTWDAVLGDLYIERVEIALPSPGNTGKPAGCCARGSNSNPNRAPWRVNLRGILMKILNLTQHPATEEQIEAGVIDLSPDDRALLAQALTFDEVPDQSVLNTRATTIALMAAGHSGGARSAMIGGAPYFMRPLERALWEQNIRPLYAFSIRESIERPRPSGAVEKIAVFRHVGFVGSEFMEISR